MEFTAAKFGVKMLDYFFLEGASDRKPIG